LLSVLPLSLSLLFFPPNVSSFPLVSLSTRNHTPKWANCKFSLQPASENLESFTLQSIFEFDAHLFQFLFLFLFSFFDWIYRAHLASLSIIFIYISSYFYPLSSSV